MVTVQIALINPPNSIIWPIFAEKFPTRQQDSIILQTALELNIAATKALTATPEGRKLLCPEISNEMVFWTLTVKGSIPDPCYFYHVAENVLDDLKPTCIVNLLAQLAKTKELPYCWKLLDYLNSKPNLVRVLEREMNATYYFVMFNLYRYQLNYRQKEKNYRDFSNSRDPEVTKPRIAWIEKTSAFFLADAAKLPPRLFKENSVLLLTWIKTLSNWDMYKQIIEVFNKRDHFLWNHLSLDMLMRAINVAHENRIQNQIPDFENKLFELVLFKYPDELKDGDMLRKFVTLLLRNPQTARFDLAEALLLTNSYKRANFERVIKPIVQPQHITIVLKAISESTQFETNLRKWGDFEPTATQLDNYILDIVHWNVRRDYKSSIAYIVWLKVYVNYFGTPEFVRLQGYLQPFTPYPKLKHFIKKLVNSPT